MTNKEFDYPIITFETHSCPACREQFIAACESELQEKLKSHNCRSRPKSKCNKKRERTRQLHKRRIALSVHDTVVNSIEKHNFDKLVKSGMLVNG